MFWLDIFWRSKGALANTFCRSYCMILRKPAAGLARSIWLRTCQVFAKNQNYHLKIHLVKQKESRDSQKSWTLAPGLKSSDLIESNTCNPVFTYSLLFKHPLKTEGAETKIGFETLCVTATPMDDKDVPSETVMDGCAHLQYSFNSRTSMLQRATLCA